ncbi:MAG: 50S ribosomal protein L6 [candidate division KSB1 bacterium]|nr:50S ribosomal protein L6 [candidate division KSB1 bacterium]
MSRIGKLPIPIPETVTLSVQENLVTAKGPKGELAVRVHPQMILQREGDKLLVRRPDDSKTFRSLHGLYRTLIANAIEGVTKGYERRLEIVGVGYRAEMRGRNLALLLGYSHDILIKPPAGIEFATEGNNVIVVRGIDKELVGQICAKIRAQRPPEPYKGKGIRYAGEQVRRKAGKSAGK